MVGEVSLVTPGLFTCCITVDHVECQTEAENPAESHHVVAGPGVGGLLLQQQLLCPELRWLMLTSLAVAGTGYCVAGGPGHSPSTFSTDRLAGLLDTETL